MITHPTQKLLHLVATHQIDVAVATPPPHNTDANLLSLCVITPIQVNNSISACYLVNIGAGVGLIHPEALAGGAFANLVKIAFLPRVSMTTFLYLPKVPVNAALSERFVRKLREVCGPPRTRKA